MCWREIRDFTPDEGLETTSTTGAVKGLIRKHGGVAVVDVIGIGAGVVHQLREKKVAVIPFHAAEHSRHTDRSGELGFVNMRAAAWWGMRERLDPAFGATIALPPDDELTADLTAPRRLPLTSGGKIQIEGKDAIRARLGRSTDAGDAAVQAFALELLSRHKPSTRISSLAVERVSPHNL